MRISPNAVDAGIAAQRRAVTRYTRELGRNDERIERLTIEDIFEAALPLILQEITLEELIEERGKA